MPHFMQYAKVTGATRSGWHWHSWHFKLYLSTSCRASLGKFMEEHKTVAGLCSCYPTHLRSWKSQASDPQSSLSQHWTPNFLDLQYSQYVYVGRHQTNLLLSQSLNRRFGRRFACYRGLSLKSVSHRPRQMYAGNRHVYQMLNQNCHTSQMFGVNCRKCQKNLRMRQTTFQNYHVSQMFYENHRMSQKFVHSHQLSLMFIKNDYIIHCRKNNLEMWTLFIILKSFSIPHTTTML